MADNTHKDSAQIWKPVPGWEGYYEIAFPSLSVRSVERSVYAGRGSTQVRPSKTLKAKIKRDYLEVVLHREGVSKHVRLHRIVCEIANGPIPSPVHVVRHLNGDRFDNRPCNLAWGTPADNSADMVKHGKSLTGSKNHAANLNEQGVLDIRARLASGERQVDIAKDYGVWQGTVSAIATGRAWAWLGGER